MRHATLSGLICACRHGSRGALRDPGLRYGTALRFEGENRRADKVLQPLTMAGVRSHSVLLRQHLERPTGRGALSRPSLVATRRPQSTSPQGRPRRAAQPPVPAHPPAVRHDLRARVAIQHMVRRPAQCHPRSSRHAAALCINGFCPRVRSLEKRGLMGDPFHAPPTRSSPPIEQGIEKGCPPLPDGECLTTGWPWRPPPYTILYTLNNLLPVAVEVHGQLRDAKLPAEPGPIG